MMDDAELVRRLRGGINGMRITVLGNVQHGEACLEAADRIEALSAAVPADLEEAGKVLEGVTPGPWTVEYKSGTTRLLMNGDCQMCDENYYPWVPENLKDWEFIAWCREGVPALIALATAQAALEAIYGDPDGWTRDAIRDLPALDLTPQPDEAEKWKRAFAAQSSKLQAVLHIPGVKDALAAMEGKP